MSIRYALGSKGVVTYGIESSKYTKESNPNKEFGLTPNDIEPPNENPQTAMPTGGGGRTVYLNSPDEKEYNFSASTVVHNEEIPLEIAIGDRATETVDIGSTGTDDYEKITWTESDRLTTATIRHINTDLDHVRYFVGCKANITLSWAQGDPLEAEFDITPAKSEYDENESPSSFTPNQPQDKTPFRAHHLGTVEFTNPSDDSSIKSLATVMGGDLSVDNGLEPNHHGQGRDAYSVSEETAADGRHDHTLDVKVTDTELFRRAHDDEAPVDVEIPFEREEDGDGNIVDGMFVRLKNCTISSADIPYSAEGTVEGSVSLMPRSIEIEMRVPL